MCSLLITCSNVFWFGVRCCIERFTALVVDCALHTHEQDCVRTPSWHYETAVTPLDVVRLGGVVYVELLGCLWPSSFII